VAAQGRQARNTPSSIDPRKATRPLFVTRKYPPSVGGMQTLAASVWKALERGAPGARLVAHGGSNRMMPAWLLHALPRVAAAVGRKKVDSALTGDALMYALCRPIFVAGQIPNATMIHGADVTHPNPVYRTVVHPALRRAPLIVANSQATAEAAISVGVRRERVSVVRLGVVAPPDSPPSRQEAADSLRRRLHIGEDRVLLVTLGRLVRRKGVVWFVSNVLTRLPANVTYLVAGDGPLAVELQRTVAECGLGERVHVMGAVDDADRERLLRGADIFVQPNIRVPGDMEGFGLVLIEAAMRGTTTIASGIEGILDAVVDGQTGFLVPAGDADAWTERLTSLVSRPSALPGIGARFEQVARALYSEEHMSQELLRLLSGTHPSV
jgi:phosphatidylinositol alpha-1,6-mannosyltransferase